MKQTDKIAALSRTALFGELETVALEALAEKAVLRQLAKDEILFSTGEPAHGLYVVVSGSVRAFRTNLEGREQIIHIERAGSTLAEVPVFDGGAYPSTVAAEEAAQVLLIEAGQVRKLCLLHPQIALAALKLLARRLRNCASLVETLALHEVGQRLAAWIWEEAQARGVSTGGGVSFELKGTYHQLAARIGTVREVISRTMARLQQDGLIVVEGRRITIPGEAEMRRFLEER